MNNRQRKPLFYSLPSVGNKIPVRTLLRCLIGSRENWDREDLESIKNYLKVKHIIYLSSGRAALWLALKSIARIRPQKREIVIPAYTCPAIVSAVLKANLKPVLCDINIDDFGFKTENLKPRINKDTLAIIAVHLFGFPSNIEEVREFCERNDVFLIEDAAQAFGNSLLKSSTSKLGLLGDVGFFSFGRGKPLSLGHGGIVVTRSDEIFVEATRIFKNISQKDGYSDLRYMFLLGAYSIFSNPYLYWILQNITFFHLGETIFEPGFKISRGMDLAACLTTKLLPSIEKEKEIRKKNTMYYAEGLEGIPEITKITFPEFPYLRYPLILNNKRLRGQILDQLVKRGTGAALFYPTPLNELPGLREILEDRNIYPNAIRLSEGLITLPVHSGVTPSHREKIVKLIRKNLLSV